jgi:hypothetical protein
MPVIDDFARAQPLSAADHSTATVVAAARRTRANALHHCLIVLWRKLTRPSVTTAVDWTAWRGE